MFFSELLQEMKTQMFISDVSKQAVYLLVENTEVRESPNWTITVNMRDKFVVVLHLVLLLIMI